MHGFANPARFLRIARWLMPALLLAGLALAAAALGWGLLFDPADWLQGETVRIMYIHVPAAWLGMMGWAGIAAASLAELVWRHPLAAIAARAMALPGATFTAICLITGSLWGRPAWGTWWVWDGRLTSMLVCCSFILAISRSRVPLTRMALANRAAIRRCWRSAAIRADARRDGALNVVQESKRSNSQQERASAAQSGMVVKLHVSFTP